ncbi:SDR family NAD(P)-dependent oxidoreductase [Salipaludibacillus aurantiacus]|uniref:NADP-dependent 3-hydroxy acid dehydrogenase YdfG n=1 Tax=Salipaludibacillus aurantiacus TaxID=1601833 RepID=A0A1H9VPV2_9BACI|nr:SDR family NAD(P)-dependent oxidoreductase [Salipaludibacillus aurantiacus]SES23766.1 NADP-dependent 3-hydroxy acid dehydrogenase YdfG [Salipaludibacillus aurantiacus]
MTKQIVLITGANSGFGRGIAMSLAQQNYVVIAGIRNMSNKANLLEEADKLGISEGSLTVKKLDVTLNSDIRDIYAFIKKRFGRIDILINNAGYSQGGVLESVSDTEWEKQFQTNVLGVASVTRAFIPMMREARNGKVINIGSISGKAGFPGLAPYAASKHALEGLSESLRLELKPFNVYTSLVEAGSFKTGIWEKGIAGAPKTDIEDYRRLMAYMESYARQMTERAEAPEKVIKLVTDICRHSAPRFRYRTGKGITGAILIKTLLPWSLYERFVLRYMQKS